MDNKEKYKNCFKTSFSLDDDIDIELLEYEKITEWDSIGHMALMAALEDAFEIEMDIDDIIEFSSYNKGIEILMKYEVSI